MRNEDLYKSRSFAGCIKSACDMVVTNPIKILKATWLPTIILAIAETFIMLTYIPDMTITQFGFSYPALTLTLMVLCWILSVIASIWFISSIYRLVNGQSFKETCKRSAIITIFYSIVCILISSTLAYGSPAFATFLIKHKLMAAPTAITGSYLTATILAIAIIAALLPAVSSGTEYLVEKETSWRNILGTGYKRGWKHWGFLFTTNLMTLITATCFGFLCLLPLLIIGGAQTANQLGMLNGDPNGAPSYFRWLLIATSIITLTFMNYIFLWGCMVNYYVMGSINQREEEKAAAKSNTTDNMPLIYE